MQNGMILIYLVKVATATSTLAGVFEDLYQIPL